MTTTKDTVSVALPDGRTVDGVPRDQADDVYAALTATGAPSIDALTRTPPAMSVHQAIARVMAELEAVGKDSKGPAEQGGYAYRGVEAVTGALQKLCGRHGVVLWPSARVVGADPAVGMKAGWFDWRVEVTYNVAGPDGSTLEPPITVLGIGRDNSDKGVNKAMTQAYKYALLQLFMVADAKDDTDAHGSYDGGRVTDAERAPQLLPKDVAETFAADIKALPSEAREHLVRQWMAEDPMTGDPYLPVVDGKPALRFVLAEHEHAVMALIVEARRVAKGTGLAPVAPQDSLDGVPGTVGPDDAETGTETPDDDSPH